MDRIKFILLCIIFGSNFLWIRIVVEDLGPFLLVFYRVLFAFIAVLIYAAALKTRIVLAWKKLGIAFVLGLFNVTLPFLFTSWAEQHITSGLAGMINSAFPLFALLLGSFFLPQERIPWRQTLGLLLGFYGVVILSSSGFNEGGSAARLEGILIMLLAPLSFAVSLVFARATSLHLDEKEQSIGQVSFALVTITAATLLFEPHWRLPSRPVAWVGVLWLGILCTGVGTFLWYSLLHSIGPTKTSIVVYLSPVIAVLLGILVLSEPFTWRLGVGGILVVAGLVWVNSSRFQKNSSFHLQ